MLTSPSGRLAVAAGGAAVGGFVARILFFARTLFFFACALVFGVFSGYRFVGFLGRFLIAFGAAAGLVIDLAVPGLPGFLPFGAFLLLPFERVFVALDHLAVVDGAAPALDLVGVKHALGHHVPPESA